MTAADWGPQEWETQEWLTDLKAARDEPTTEVIAYALTQSAWDRRKVHQLGQVEHTVNWLRANQSRPDAELIARGAVMLRAEQDADEVERTLGVRTDPEGIDAYLAVTPAAQQPAIAAPDRPVCPVCGEQRARLSRHLRRMHPSYTPEGAGDG